MSFFFFMSFMLGVIVVVQPLLNRLVFEQKGLSFAVFFNGAVLCLTAGGFLCMSSLAKDRFPEFMHLKPEVPWQWWYVLPGLLGFLLVFFVPLMMKSIGAFSSVVTMMVGQVMTSFLIDMVRGEALSWPRVLGLSLAISAAYLSFRPTV